MPVFDDLVTGWWEYQRLLRGSRDERQALLAGHPAHVYASWTQVTERITAGGLPALDLVAALVEGAPTDADVSLVGAGPLEDLVHKHGNSLASEIANLASRNPSFEHALSGVWLAHGVLTPAAEERLSQWIIVTGAARHRHH